MATVPGSRPLPAGEPVPAGGMQRFDEFMADALYGPRGFYTSGGRAGRRGDFITSPEVGPLFGAVVARALDGVWDGLGRPDDFRVVEAGAGPGTLARSVVAAAPQCLGGDPGRYVCVEVSDAQRMTHPAAVRSSAGMPAEPFSGVILANELLDNLPFRLAVFDGGWRDALVRRDGDRWVEILGTPRPPEPWLPATAVQGARVPIQEAAASWLLVARRLLSGGRVMVIDYMSPRTADLAVRPWREWLRTYRAHERGVHYLRDVGEQDITAQVCLDQLVAVNGEPDALRTQAQFLRRWGIEEMVEEGRRVWAEQASRPGLEAMRARSRIREAEALLDPAGLGGFMVAEWAAAPG